MGKPLCGSVLMNSAFPYIWHRFFSMFPAQKSLGDGASGTRSMGDAWCHLFRRNRGTPCSHAAARVLLGPEPPEAPSCQHVIVYSLRGNKNFVLPKKRGKKNQENHPKRNKFFLSAVFHM